MRPALTVPAVGSSPRVRGKPAARCTSGGSSPRVRGKQRGHHARTRVLRLIPARAGKTAVFRRSGPCGWAHPRACGENMARPRRDRSRMGSSPRVRGKRRRECAHGRPRGLIPARAGKTRASPWQRLSRRAHPRACGENDGGPTRRITDDGSSPRVRGKRVDPIEEAAESGLIPARAGKTRRRRGRSCGLPAHPRACGENRKHRGHPFVRLGSSPRVRGKPDNLSIYGVRHGLIPARAGKTGAARGRPDHCWAHPRACGENASFDVHW